MKITLEFLEKNDTHHERIQWFKRNFKTEGDFKDVVKKLIADKEITFCAIFVAQNLEYLQQIKLIIYAYNRAYKLIADKEVKRLSDKCKRAALFFLKNSFKCGDKFLFKPKDEVKGSKYIKDAAYIASYAHELIYYAIYIIIYGSAHADKVTSAILSTAKFDEQLAYDYSETLKILKYGVKLILKTHEGKI